MAGCHFGAALNALIVGHIFSTAFLFKTRDVIPFRKAVGYLLTIVETRVMDITFTAAFLLLAFRVKRAKFIAFLESVTLRHTLFVSLIFVRTIRR